MDYFNLSSAYRCSNYLEGYDCFVVQCDDMYCHTIATNNELCLSQWIVRLISHTSPNSGERMKVFLSAPALLRDNVSVPLPALVSMIFSKVYVKPDDFLQSNWRLSKLSLDKIMFATLDCFFRLPDCESDQISSSIIRVLTL
ncbi:hypothetical protein OIU77_018071 [Salix suchowensis]|uniref:Uncharacterized protein n=1 Tax=Salix suchowensis TaxID=1278906 RepID=A0ABQ8ZR80_9ROSI|nr:hypothetical protein OIU77_018071 [Salix suchowensis]